MSISTHICVKRIHTSTGISGCIIQFDTMSSEKKIGRASYIGYGSGGSIFDFSCGCGLSRQRGQTLNPVINKKSNPAHSYCALNSYDYTSHRNTFQLLYAPEN